MVHSGQTPGFFGKLRSHGDFVGRRLPAALRHRFDQWLQEGLVRSKQELGQDWLPTWSTSPLWRFVVGEGVCDEHAWAGVMMPSADRVGRCFPLLVVARIDGRPSLSDCLTLHIKWFAQLERIALSTLEAEASLNAFDHALQLVGDGPRGIAGEAGEAGLAEPPGSALVAGISYGEMPSLAASSLEGRSAWWTDGSPRVAPSLVVCAGLPSAAAYPALLDGRWAERGWLCA